MESSLSPEVICRLRAHSVYCPDLSPSRGTCHVYVCTPLIGSKVHGFIRVCHNRRCESDVFVRKRLLRGRNDGGSWARPIANVFFFRSQTRPWVCGENDARLKGGAIRFPHLITSLETPVAFTFFTPNTHPLKQLPWRVLPEEPFIFKMCEDPHHTCYSFSSLFPP